MSHRGPILWLMLCCCAPLASHAADPAPGAETPLRYRRVYAPSDDIANWPRPAVPYVPIDPQEFERAVGAVQSAPIGAAAAVARIERASYAARLEGDTFTGGKAHWTVVHRGRTPTIVPIVPCGLALGDAVWQESQAPAVLGVGEDEKLLVVAEGSGTLSCDWSLRGQTDVTGALAIDFEVPRCPHSTLELDLAEGVTLTSTQGLVTSDAPPAGGRRRWRIELGGRYATRLRIATADVASQRSRLPLVRTATSYEFSARGVDVISQWRLEVQHDPLRRVVVSLDPGLQLVSVRYGEMAVPWSALADESPPDENARPTRIAVELPDPVRGAGRILRLTAMAPLEIDELRRLPTLQPVGMAWQEGTLNLLVPAPFVIRQLTPTHCRQSKVGALPAPLSGESVELQSFGPEASVEVAVTRRRENVRLATGAAIALGSGELHCTLVADLRLAVGERFTLRADVSEGWIVDSVQSVPADAISDWSVGSNEAGRAGRNLSIRLGKALTPNHPIRLIVEGRGRSNPLGNELGQDDLRMLDLQGATPGVQLLALRANGPYQLRVEDQDDLVYLDPHKLTAAQRELFVGEPPELVFELNPRAAAWRVAVEPLSLQYSAALQVEATVTAGQLEEAYVFQCTPTAGRIEKLLVRFSEARPQPPSWTLGTDTRGQFTARRVAGSQPDKAAAADLGETWELTLRRPRTTAFEVRARRTTPMDGEMAVGLASLPDAESQRGEVIVGARGDLPFSITNRRLRPTYPAAPSEGSFTNTRAAYRFEPSQETASGVPAALTVAAVADQTSHSGAAVWRLQLDSRFEPGGRALHRATALVRNDGRPKLAFTLPSEAELQGAWLDDRPVAFESGTLQPAGGALAFNLASKQRFITATLEFATRHAAWENYGSLSAPALEADVPILARHWNVWLPPEYELLATSSWQRLDARRPAWHQRLFGVLSRPQQETPFNPLIADDWLALAGISPAREAATARARAFLSELATSTATTWGEAVAQAAARTVDPGQGSIDARALGELGLGASTPLPRRSASIAGASALANDGSDDSAATGLALLEQANLALVVSDRSWLLTSAPRVAADAWQFAPLGSHALLWARPGMVQIQLDSSPVDRPAGLMSIAAWRAAPQAPWTFLSATGAQPASGVGWSVYRLEGVSDGAASVYVLRRASLQMVGWVMFFLAYFVVWRMLRRRRAWTWWGVMACATAALLLPAAVTPLASGALLGTLFSLARDIALPPRRRATLPVVDAAASPSQLVPAVQALVYLAIGVGLALGASRLAAADGAPENPTWSVFIPSDADGKPDGGRYQVPSEFWEELRRREARALGAPQGWLLGQAQYEATLAWDASQTALELAEFLVRLEVHTFEPGARVRIPLGPWTLTNAPNRAVVDGRILQVDWDPNQKVLVVDVDEVGTCLLEMSLRPEVKSAARGMELDLSIPRVATSTLQLRVPPGAPPVAVASARGATVWTEDRQEATCALGPTDRLTLQWNGAGRGVSAVDVEELLWLKVLPGSVVLDARLQLKPTAGVVEELKLHVDPRLRLLPPTAQDPTVAEIRGETGDAAAAGVERSLVVRLARPTAEPAVVSLSFMLTGRSGVGQVRLPRVDLPGVRVTHRRLGVSVDPALEFDAQSGEGLTSLAVPTFAAQWGEARTLPQLAYDLPRSETDWTLNLRPRPPTSTARQSLAISYFQGGAALDYEASLNTSGGFTFQHRLLAPETLDVESVSVIEDGLQRTAQWSRDTQGSLTVFFGGPITGEHRIALRGTMRTPSTGKSPMPVVRLRDIKAADESISLFRQRAVVVGVDELQGLTDAPVTARLDDRPESGRLVRALVVQGDAPAATVTLAPNNPQARVVQVTSLRREASAWQVETDCTWTVEQGLLDVLRLEVPQSWTGPWKLDPPVASELLDVPGRSVKHLVVRPRSAVRDTFRLSIVAPLKVAAGDAIAWPNIVPLGVDAAERYVRLPTQLGVQQADWETAELQAATLPEAIASRLTAEAARTFRVIGDTPLARLRSVEAVAIPRRVRLLDVQLAWTADRRYRGLATYDLAAGGVMSWRLGVRPGCRLVQGSVDGRVVMLEPAGDNLWTVPAPLGELPERIEVLFEGQLPDGSTMQGPARFEAPVLVDLPVDRTLWTIYAPPEAGVGRPQSAPAAQTLLHDLARLQGLTALCDLPDDVVATLTPDELRHGFQPWRRRWIAAREAVRRELLDGPRTAANLEAEAEAAALDRQHTQSLERLEWVPAGDAPAPASIGPAALWAAAFDSGRTPTRCILSGNETGVTLDYPHAGGADLASRVGWAASLVLLAIGAVVLVRRGVPLVDWLFRWPHALGVVVGLAWWLWLQPSALGLALALACVVLSLRLGFRPARESASAVVHLGSAK